MFNEVDLSLSRVSERLGAIQEVAANAKFTVEELQQRISEIAHQEAIAQLADQFELKEKGQQLGAGLQQATLTVEAVKEAVEQVGKVVKMGNELGLSIDAAWLEPLLKAIADVQAELGRASEAAGNLSEHLGAGRDDATLGERAERVANVLARLLATFGNVDSRLEAFQDRLTASQANIKQVSSQTHFRMVAVAVVATLFLLWMAAGQVCLWRHGEMGACRL